LKSLKEFLRFELSYNIGLKYITNLVYNFNESSFDLFCNCENIISLVIIFEGLSFGICFFKYQDRQSLKFLKKLTNFYDYKIKYHKQLFWSVDQFGLGLIQNIMNNELKIFNFYNHRNILNFNKILYVPRLLALKKIKSKFKNRKLDE
jgi:hypothetical protein